MKIDRDGLGNGKTKIEKKEINKETRIKIAVVGGVIILISLFTIKSCSKNDNDNNNKNITTTTNSYKDGNYIDTEESLISYVTTSLVDENLITGIDSDNEEPIVTSVPDDRMEEDISTETCGTTNLDDTNKDYDDSYNQSTEQDTSIDTNVSNNDMSNKTTNTSTNKSEDESKSTNESVTKETSKNTTVTTTNPDKITSVNTPSSSTQPTWQPGSSNQTSIAYTSSSMTTVPTSVTTSPSSATTAPTSVTTPPTSATTAPTSVTTPPTSATTAPTSVTTPPTNTTTEPTEPTATEPLPGFTDEDGQLGIETGATFNPYAMKVLILR